MIDRKTKFSFSFPENQKRDGNLPTTRQIAFDDLGDFVEERERVRRALERNSITNLKIDYSDFENHVFFDSAYQKFEISKNKILTRYPYNGSSEQKDNFVLSSSGYENYVLDEQWPKNVGYLTLNGTSQFVSASDTKNILNLNSSSLYVSAFIKPTDVTGIHSIISYLSSSTALFGYEFHLSGAVSPHLKFTMYSASLSSSVSASYFDLSSSFRNVAAIYDEPANLISLYIGATRVATASCDFGPIQMKGGVNAGGKVYVGGLSASLFYSGSIDEVRIFHTASELFHVKNQNRSISSEDFLKLKYSFNEGVTGRDTIDAIVVDYSQNAIHGVIGAYSASCRISGTSMVSELGDPILYGYHPLVAAFTSSMYESASLYDNTNNNFIFNMIPGPLLEDDNEQSGLLSSFALAMARYFDDLKSYIDQFENIKITNYEDVNEVPDLFLPYLTQYFGWKATEHFNDANPLQFFFGENVLNSGSLEAPLYEIRNQFWRRILNNLPYLYATKGKRNSFDSLFNVLGLNKENISLKEYGYLPGGTLVEERIHKEKPISVLGITGSMSSSYIKVPLLMSASRTTYTVETHVQLPFFSASFSSSLLTGSVWQFATSGSFTPARSFSLWWAIPYLSSPTGKFILTGSDGQSLSTTELSIFEGDWVYVAAGLNANSIPFIEVKTIDNDIIDFSSSFSGSTALSGVFTGSLYDFVMGANSGSSQNKFTRGRFAEYRVWSRKLSGSEMNAHALHFENVGTYDPSEFPSPLIGHWPLNDNLSASSAGEIPTIIDYSRNLFSGSAWDFIPSYNNFDKVMLEYNYLSPSVDLKWTENKIRIRNKTVLKKSEIATDTNEVALEFSLVDALNEDIMKIFSTFDVLHNAIGEPVNKYRDEYSTLEGIRTTYFKRLGDTIHFNKFFNLFTWFDKKISDSIKQLLPTRVKFIGGEQVVESHFLERPRYKFQYPVFRTPVDMPNIDISASISLNSEVYGYNIPEIIVSTGSLVTIDCKIFGI
jgi:hypothetical protein